MNQADRAYPAQEHLERANTMASQLKQELATYPDGPSLRETRKWLVPTYGNTPFARSLRRYAWIVQHAHTVRPPDHHNPEQAFAMPFYMGALISTHCLTRPMTQRERQDVLECNFMNFEAEPDSRRLAAYLNRVCAAALEAEDTAFVVLSRQSDEVQELALTAAARTFDGLEYASSRENEYVFGFVFAGSMAVEALRLADEYRRRP